MPHFGRDGKDGESCFFAHLISFLAIFSHFLPLCHRILPIVSPVSDIFKTPGMAIAIPAILVSPPLGGTVAPLLLILHSIDRAAALLCLWIMHEGRHCVPASCGWMTGSHSARSFYERCWRRVAARPAVTDRFTPQPAILRTYSELRIVFATISHSREEKWEFDDRKCL